jgi:hypothetical protein
MAACDAAPTNHKEAMMKAVIEINMDSAAFADSPEAELARILRQIAVPLFIALNQSMTVEFEGENGPNSPLEEVFSRRPQTTKTDGGGS